MAERVCVESPSSEIETAYVECELIRNWNRWVCDTQRAVSTREPRVTWISLTGVSV